MINSDGLPSRTGIWSQAEWQMYVERRIGPWIDAMLEVPEFDRDWEKDQSYSNPVSDRRAIADNLAKCGLIIVGEDSEGQWTWSVGPSFDREHFERLMDL